jgi:hypothetical protein
VIRFPLREGVLRTATGTTSRAAYVTARVAAAGIRPSSSLATGGSAGSAAGAGVVGAGVVAAGVVVDGVVADGVVATGVVAPRVAHDGIVDAASFVDAVDPSAASADDAGTAAQSAATSVSAERRAVKP